MSGSTESREATGVRAWILGAVVAALSLVFFQRFVLVELLARRLFFPSLLALAEGAAIVGVGSVIRRAIDRVLGEQDVSTSPARVAFDFIVGYPLFGAICFLIALVTTHETAMLSLLLGGVALTAASMRSTRFGWRALRVETTPLPVAAIALLALAALVVFLSAQMPPVSLDELAYHLTVPKTWVAEGRAVELPLLSHSYFPLGIESADLPLLSILGDDGALASHLLHAIGVIATVAVIFGWASRRASMRTAFLVVLSIATTPALLLTGGWSLNDWAIAGACAALFVSLEERLQGGDASRGSGGAAALALAAGLLTKYTFVPVAAVLILAYILSVKTLSKNDRVALAVGVAAGSVFYVRNLVLTGNPFAPFFASDAPAVARYRGTASILETFRGYVFDGRFLDESLGVLLIALTFAFLLLVRNLASERFLLASGCGAAVVTAILFAMAPSSRILLPPLVVVALAAVVALDRFLEASSAAAMAASWIVVALALGQLFLCGAYVATQKPFTILSGQVSDAEFVATVRPVSLDVVFADLNLPKESRALVVGMNELYWFSHRVRGGGNFDGPRVARMFDGDAATVQQRLRSDAITHLVVFPGGLRPSAAGVKSVERGTSLTPAQDSTLQELLGTATPVASNPRVAVYALR